jgi:hypothetical protein
MTALEIELTLQVFLAFGSVALLDYVWAKYTYAMTSHKPVLAGAYASAIFGLGGAAVLTYASNPWMLVPAVAGAFVGTWVAVKGE